MHLFPYSSCTSKSVLAGTFVSLVQSFALSAIPQSLPLAATHPMRLISAIQCENMTQEAVQYSHSCVLHTIPCYTSFDNAGLFKITRRLASLSFTKRCNICVDIVSSIISPRFNSVKHWRFQHPHGSEQRA